MSMTAASSSSSSDGSSGVYILASDAATYALSQQCANAALQDYSQHLSIAAVFIILTASLLGTGLPLLFRRFPALLAYPFLVIVGKHVGTGVLPALVLVHLLAPAFDELGNPCLPSA